MAVSTFASSSYSCWLAPARHRTCSAPPSSASPPCCSRFISLLSLASPTNFTRHAIFAISPDHYRIPHVPGVPVGKKLKLFNLPPGCELEELIDWIQSADVRVEFLEFTDDPELNAAGVNAFLEMCTEPEASMAIVRLDGRRFKGRCVRMDYVEKRPHERDISGRRNRPRDSNNLVDKFEPRTGYRSNNFETGSSDGSSSSARPYNGIPFSSNRIFVGNLAWTTDEASLERLFSCHGTVHDARVLRDRESGRSRGVGFVVMSTAEEMHAAITALNGQEVEGRSLRVNVAASRE